MILILSHLKCKKLIGILLFFLMAWALVIAATPNEPTNNSQNNLKKINQQVDQLKQQITQKKQTYSELQEDLKKIELHYGTTTQLLETTNQKLESEKNSLVNLNDKVKSNRNTITQQQKQLLAQLQAAYILGNQPYLKILLEQNEATTSSQLIHYFHFLTEYQVELIENLKHQILLLQVNEQARQQHYQALQSLEDKQNKEQQQLSLLKNNRSHLIIQINHSIQNKNQQLKQLEANQEELEKTLNQLHESPIHELTENFIGGKDLVSLKGHLPWPTAGHIENSFGSLMDEGGLRWDGVLINAQLNQPVYAVADGEVVFAKWLMGYGLLMIIKHGHGYMTLYGRNHLLYKKPGDKVRAGDLIATVGQTGGFDTPELYFAIRYNAQPLDPSKWCR